MYHVNVLKQELGSAKLCKQNLLDERTVVERHRCYMAAKFGVCLLTRNQTSFLCYIGYQNFMQGRLNHVLLLILARVLGICLNLHATEYCIKSL